MCWVLCNERSAVSHSHSELGRQDCRPQNYTWSRDSGQVLSHDLGDLPREEVSSQAVAPAAPFLLLGCGAAGRGVLPVRYLLLPIGVLETKPFPG